MRQCEFPSELKAVCRLILGAVRHRKEKGKCFVTRTSEKTRHNQEGSGNVSEDWEPSGSPKYQLLRGGDSKCWIGRREWKWKPSGDDVAIDSEPVGQPRWREAEASMSSEPDRPA